MKRAAVTGAAVWVVPTIVSMDAAQAAMRAGSAKPKTPPPPITNTNTPPPTSAPPVPMKTVIKHGPQLPFTGDNQEFEMGISVTALTLGVALQLMGETERTLGD